MVERSKLETIAPMDLAKSLFSPDCVVPILEEIKSVEDLHHIANDLPRIINQYAYLMELSAYLKIMIRQAKRNHEGQKAEDLIDKQNAIQNAIEVLKLQQKTLSRVITIKQMENEELGMY